MGDGADDLREYEEWSLYNRHLHECQEEPCPRCDPKRYLKEYYDERRREDAAELLKEMK